MLAALKRSTHEQERSSCRQACCGHAAAGNSSAAGPPGDCSPTCDGHHSLPVSEGEEGDDDEDDLGNLLESPVVVAHECVDDDPSDIHPPPAIELKLMKDGVVVEEEEEMEEEEVEKPPKSGPDSDREFGQAVDQAMKSTAWDINIEYCMLNEQCCTPPLCVPPNTPDTYTLNPPPSPAPSVPPAAANTAESLVPGLLVLPGTVSVGTNSEPPLGDGSARSSSSPLCAPPNTPDVNTYVIPPLPPSAASTAQSLAPCLLSLHETSSVATNSEHLLGDGCTLSSSSPLCDDQSTPDTNSIVDGELGIKSPLESTAGNSPRFNLVEPCNCRACSHLKAAMPREKNVSRAARSGPVLERRREQYRSMTLVGGRATSKSLPPSAENMRVRCRLSGPRLPMTMVCRQLSDISMSNEPTDDDAMGAYSAFVGTPLSSDPSQSSA